MAKPINKDTKAAFARWNKLPPIYCPRWAWELACRKEPHKYSIFLPEYQNRKVMLT